MSRKVARILATVMQVPVFHAPDVACIGVRGFPVLRLGYRGTNRRLE